MTPLRFTIPGVPIAKGRPRIGTRAGRPCAFTPPRTVAYEGMVALVGQEAMQGRPLLDGAVKLELAATFPIAASWSKAKRADALAGRLWHVSRPDGDNILKAIGDGLNGVVWTDDSRIAVSSIVKVYGAMPGVEVLVTALESAAVTRDARLIGELIKPIMARIERGLADD